MMIIEAPRKMISHLSLQYMMIIEAPRKMISHQAPVGTRVENAIHPINSMPCEADALLQTFVC